MKNTNRQPSSGSVLLGMAAGAALGAVGTMAMAQRIFWPEMIGY